MNLIKLKINVTQRHLATGQMCGNKKLVRKEKDPNHCKKCSNWVSAVAADVDANGKCRKEGETAMTMTTTTAAAAAAAALTW